MRAERMKVTEGPRSMVLLLLILVVAFSLRLSPYLISGVPYHTDSWTMFPLVDTLLEKSPVPLRPEMGFDDYNIYWPGLPLFAAFLSNVVGIKPILLLPIASPLVSSFSILILYSFLRRMGSNTCSALTASLLFGLAGGEAVLTAGVTKEGYALPLFLLFLFLLATGLRNGSAKFGLSLLVLIPALILSHHLTSVVALVLSAYLLFSNLLYPESRGSSLRWTALILLVFGLSLLAYFYFHAGKALPFRLGETDATSLMAYQILFLLPFVLSPSFIRKPSYWVRLWIRLALALAVGLMLAALKLRIMIGAPTISVIDLLLLSPYVCAAFLAVFGAGQFERTCGRGGITFIGFWILGFLAIELYIIFGTPGMPSNAYRIGNFLFMGVLILTSSSYVSFGRKRILGTILLSLVVVGMGFTLPYTSFLSGPIGGSQRVYSEQDVVQARWILERCHGVVYGDIRLSYLLYNRLNVSVHAVLPFLLGESKPPEGCLVLTKLMKEVGYIASAHGIELDPQVLISLNSYKRASLVYSSEKNMIFFVKNTSSKN